MINTNENKMIIKFIKGIFVECEDFEYSEPDIFGRFETEKEAVEFKEKFLSHRDAYVRSLYYTVGDDEIQMLRCGIENPDEWIKYLESEKLRSEKESHDFYEKMSKTHDPISLDGFTPGGTDFSGMFRGFQIFGWKLKDEDQTK